MREVMQENRPKSDNLGMMSECRFDGVVETMEFKNLTDQVAHRLHRTCTAGRQASRSTRSYDVSYVEQKAPRSVF